MLRSLLVTVAWLLFLISLVIYSIVQHAVGVGTEYGTTVTTFIGHLGFIIGLFALLCFLANPIPVFGNIKQTWGGVLAGGLIVAALGVWGYFKICEWSHCCGCAQCGEECPYYSAETNHIH